MTQQSTQTIIILAVFVYLLVRRLSGRKVGGMRSLIVFALLAFYGIESVGQALHAQNQTSLSSGDVSLMVLLAAISFIMGLVRGTTVEFFMKNGELYSKYRVITVVLWIATFAVRLGLASGASHFNASKTVAEASLILMFAISIAGEQIVVRTRAASMAGRRTV